MTKDDIFLVEFMAYQCIHLPREHDACEGIDTKVSEHYTPYMARMIQNCIFQHTRMIHSSSALTLPALPINYCTNHQPSCTHPAMAPKAVQIKDDANMIPNLQNETPGAAATAMDVDQAAASPPTNLTSNVSATQTLGASGATDTFAKPATGVPSIRSTNFRCSGSFHKRLPRCHTTEPKRFRTLADIL